MKVVDVIIDQIRIKMSPSKMIYEDENVICLWMRHLVLLSKTDTDGIHNTGTETPPY